MKFDIFIARFPYGRTEDYEVGSFLARTIVEMKGDPRIGEIYNRCYDDTPITMTRNLAVEDATAANADIMLLVDSDMAPDCCLNTSDRPALHFHPHAKPFWNSTFNFMIDHKGPCMVASPYCGPPPHENIFVFHWDNIQSGSPGVDVKLSQFTRHEAAQRGGFEKVGALPTGLMAIDMRIFKNSKIPKPYFDYEFGDKAQTNKSTTEDVFFTRNVFLAGYDVYCNWDAWSGHVKRKIVLPPVIWTPDGVRKEFRDAVSSNALMSNETLVMFKSKAK